MVGYQHIERSEGVRTKDWKYIRYIDQTGTAAEELYHLTTDSLEMNDLSEEPGSAEILDKLRKRYFDYFQKKIAH